MTKIIGSPGRYIQGKGTLQNLRQYTVAFGEKLFVLVSPSGKKRVAPLIQGAQQKGALYYDIFNGECTHKEIQRITQACKAAQCQVVIGIGGGKIHDAAKAAADNLKLPVVIVPTVASTDAPCSALSVIYDENGTVADCLYFPKNPDMVLVDTELISKGPSRLFAAGMGDALSTYFEARACMRSGKGNCVGGKSTLAAFSLAKLCYDTLQCQGRRALIAVREGLCTKAVEEVIEVNTYLSGIGFESGGLAAAHAIHNGLTVIEETHAFYHGEKVAFGTIAQLVLENASSRELADVIGFCMDTGLPVTLGEIGVNGEDTEKIKKAAEVSLESDSMHNMPFSVSAEDVYMAIMGADAMGRQRKGQS